MNGRTGRRRTRGRSRTAVGHSHLLSLAAAAAMGCASAPSAADGGAGTMPHIEGSLAAYERMGLLAGDHEFPVVGQVVALRGPGDSAFVGFTASMPPSALGFAREGPLFAASYQVLGLVVSGSDTLRRLNRREIVRVDDFAETSSTEERIFFQRFLSLAPGRYDVSMTVRELSSRRQASRSFTVNIPPPGAAQQRLAAPLLAFRAAPREAYAQEPPLIVAPRSTVSAGRPPLLLVVEDYSDQDAELDVRLTAEGQVLWSERFRPPRTAGAPATAIAELHPARLPPGRAEISVQRVSEDASRTIPLMVALDDSWVFESWDQAVTHLAYEIPPDSLKLWLEASPADRPGLWAALWESTDVDPDTPQNEFLRSYFERMSQAMDWYQEPGTSGWETDRGRALVQLGAPDRELVRGGPQVGGRSEIEWVYTESLPFELRLVFVDETDFGVYSLTQRSRLLLRQAVERLRRARVSEEGERDDA